MHSVFSVSAVPPHHLVCFRDPRLGCLPRTTVTCVRAVITTSSLEQCPPVARNEEGEHNPPKRGSIRCSKPDSSPSEHLSSPFNPKKQAFVRRHSPASTQPQEVAWLFGVDSWQVRVEDESDNQVRKTPGGFRWGQRSELCETSLCLCSSRPTSWVPFLPLCHYECGWSLVFHVVCPFKVNGVRWT